ncbi:hypothetical protein G9A89_009443 [Geosiphon pyriformis]|nr:hypothetical protein G9A89_009443 [Geosiphon pyriformis]
MKLYKNPPEIKKFLYLNFETKLKTTMESNKTPIPRFLSDLQVSDPKALIFKFRNLTNEELERRKSQNDSQDKFSVSVAASRSADDFNRYCDILPFNYNRVKLCAKRSHKNDYINASYIEAPGKVRKYIATQGPLDETIDDFWLMIWEQNTAVVVMLTKEEEKGAKKCSKYWPLNKDLPIEYPETGIKVTLESEELDSNTVCIIRTIRLTKTSPVTTTFIRDPTMNIDNQNSQAPSSPENRTIKQLQFIGWPDHGVPDSPDMILQLIRKTNELQQLSINRDDLGNGNEIGPVVVHCSAGCGRTGAFCTVDSALALLPNIQDDSNDLIYHLVRHFREQRTTMVQTLGQFQYCYLAVLHKLVTEEN